MEHVSYSLQRALRDGEVDPSVGQPVEAPPPATRRERLERRRAGQALAAQYYAALAEQRQPEAELRQAPVEPRPDGLPGCTTCRGIRLVRPDVPPSHPDFGQARPCPACLARPDTAPGLAALNGRASGLEGDQLGQTFASFKPVPLARRAYQAVHLWAADPVGWLVVWGEPGCGKSHLAAAAVNDLVRRGRAVRYWYCPDLAAAARRAVGQGDGAVDGLLNDLMERPVLVLDDLGAVQMTDFALGQIFEPLLDRRYRAKRPTLISCIGSPKEIRDNLSESIGRRMEDSSRCTVVHNAAPQWPG